jgi:hypothetical protein
LAGASAQTTDPAGSYSAAGASAPTLAKPGTYIPGAGATSSAAEIVDPAGTYSAAGASALTLAAAGTYIPGTGATSSAAEIVDPAGTYGAAGASAPTLAKPGTYIPGAGATSSAAEIVDRAGTYSGAGASAPTPAAAGTYLPVTGATSVAAEIVSPPGTYLPAGASAPIADPGGTYSAAGASAPTTDPAGTYTSPYALTRLFLEDPEATPLYEVLSFNSVVAVENFYGVKSSEATLASEFFAGYKNSPAVMLFTRFPFFPARAHLYGANIINMTLSQLQAISGTLTVTSQGYNYEGSINLSNVTSFANAAIAINNALNANLPVAATTSGDSITPESVSFTGSISSTDLIVTSASPGSIAIGSYVTGSGVPAGAQITCQTSGTPGGVGTYGFYVGEGTVSSEPLTDSYGVLTVGSVNVGTVTEGQEVTGANVLPLTAIEANLSGSGAGSTWIVNNAQTVGSENMTMTGAPIQATYALFSGATASVAYFEVQQNGNFNFSSSTLSAMGGTAAASLGLTAGSGAFLSTPGQIVTDPAEWMNNFNSSYTDQYSSFQTIPVHPTETPELTAWSTSTDGLYTYLTTSTSTTSAFSSAPTTDPAGTYSGSGASAPTPAAAGTYIPVTGATSAAAELVDPAGTYSGAGASAPTTDPAGAYSGAGASAATTDPAGSYSLAGASAPTLAQPGYYVPTAGASSETPDDPGYYTPYGRDGGDPGAAAGHIGDVSGTVC